MSDPFGAAADKDLPTLGLALNPEIAWSQLKRRLPRLSGDGMLRVKAIRVTRHKPGRRCVVEYDVKIRRDGMPDEFVTLIGKVRARRSGNEAYRLQDAIWNAGFDAQSSDCISVPESIGVISDFQMWFQRRVDGVTAEKLISGPDALGLARRVAEAAHKLHAANVPAEKRHSIVEELRILRECFSKLTAIKPAWSQRLDHLMSACERLGARIPAVQERGIHRDFYSSQVIVDEARLWLIDFDLYCFGDPALDAGNFIGHITEQALREKKDATAFQEAERVLEDRFVELSGEATRFSVRAYTNLTLARHIYLSTQFAERTHLTEQLLELCEERLAR